MNDHHKAISDMNAARTAYEKAVSESKKQVRKIIAGLPEAQRKQMNAQISAMEKAAANMDIASLNKIIADLSNFAQNADGNIT